MTVKKKKKTKSMFLPILVCGVLSCTISFCVTLTIVEGKALNVSSTLLDNVKEYSTQDNSKLVQLSMVTKNLVWDNVYIFTPYMNVKEVFRRDGINFNKSISFNVEHDDTIFTVAFINSNNKLVGYVDLPVSMLNSSLPVGVALGRDRASIINNN